MSRPNRWTAGGPGGAAPDLSAYQTKADAAATYGQKADVISNGAAITALPTTYGPLHAGSSADRDRSMPIWTRVGNSPIVVGGATSTATSVYWPWVLKVAGLIANPLAPYYMWTSTDHFGVGGISLYTAATPAGPWTRYGQVFVDTTRGSSTETPSVIWDSANSRFIMYYQQYGASGRNGVQTTFIATSPDGVAWTATGQFVDVPNVNTQPGDGHTGYFNPWFNGDAWIAYSLKGGANYPHFGIWHSLDGLDWRGDPRALGYGAEWYAQTGNRLINWNHCTVIQYRGRRLIVGLVANNQSGGAAKDARMFQAPLSEDGRRLLAPPRIFLPPTGTETANYRALAILPDAGTLWLYYQTDNNIYVAKGA